MKPTTIGATPPRLSYFPTSQPQRGKHCWHSSYHPEIHGKSRETLASFRKTYMSEWSQFWNSFLCHFWLVVLFLQDQSTSKKELRRLGLGCFHRSSSCGLGGYVKVITLTYTSNITLHFCCCCVPSKHQHASPSDRMKWLNDKSGLSSFCPSLHDLSILWTDKKPGLFGLYKGNILPIYIGNHHKPWFLDPKSSGANTNGLKGVETFLLRVVQLTNTCNGIHFCPKKVIFGNWGTQPQWSETWFTGSVVGGNIIHPFFENQKLSLCFHNPFIPSLHVSSPTCQVGIKLPHQTGV